MLEARFLTKHYGHITLSVKSALRLHLAKFSGTWARMERGIIKSLTGLIEPSEGENPGSRNRRGERIAWRRWIGSCFLQEGSLSSGPLPVELKLLGWRGIAESVLLGWLACSPLSVCSTRGRKCLLRARAFQASSLSGFEHYNCLA